MFKLLWVLMLLLSAAASGLAQNVTPDITPDMTLDIASASPAEESAPQAQAQESGPPFNLGDLLPSSEDPPPEPRRMYTITDRPPQAPAQRPTREGTDTARPPAPTGEQTRTRTETALAPEQEHQAETTPVPPADRAADPATASLCRMVAEALAGDLSFLEGCWSEDGGEPPAECGEDVSTDDFAELCFDRQGQGTRTIHREGVYQGALRAWFDPQGCLTIDMGKTNVIVFFMDGKLTGRYYCAERIVITAIQDDGSLSGTVTGLTDRCCDFNRSRPVTLRRQQPGTENRPGNRTDKPQTENYPGYDPSGVQ